MIRRVSALFALLLLGYGCRQQPTTETGPAEPAVTRQYRQESITAILAVSHTNLTTAEDIRLVLDVQAPKQVEVVFPNLADMVEPLRVFDRYAEPQQTLPNGKVLHRRGWTLVPGLPGKTGLPALPIRAGQVTLQTEPVEIHVTSLLPANLEAFEIKDIADPVAFLPEQKKRRGLAAKGLAGLIFLLFILAVLRRRRTSPQDQDLPPHQIALQALLELESVPCEPVSFIHRLDHILRGYLQARFCVPALESTHGELSTLLDQPELIDFLAQCHEIKFTHSVSAGFEREAIGFTRAYIEATTEEEPPCD